MEWAAPVRSSHISTADLLAWLQPQGPAAATPSPPRRPAVGGMLIRLVASRRLQLLLPPRGAAALAHRFTSSAAADAVHQGATGLAFASVLPDTLDRASEAYRRNAAAVGGLLSDLRARVSQVLCRGGAEAVRRNAARGKLLPWDRIDRLLDPGASFLELSQEQTGDVYTGRL